MKILLIGNFAPPYEEENLHNLSLFNRLTDDGHQCTVINISANPSAVEGFIDNISTDKKTEAIIQSVIELSHAIDMEVVAEGVESSDQYELLQEMGCDYYQGYLFSKPLEYKDFFAKL